MRRRTLLVLGAALLGLALSSCRPTAQEVAEGDDALAALGARAESARYDGPFWARQAHRSTTLWSQAKGFCGTHRDEDLPNCKTVTLVERWEQPPSLPELAPPAWRLSERGYVAGDVEALKRWEARLKRRESAPGGGR